MTYIKTLTAPLIIIAGLALLTACAGGVTINAGENDSNGDPAVVCTETPFDSADMCEAQKTTACQTHGTNVEAGGHADCAMRVVASCTTNPYAHNGCNTATGINGLRTTFCNMPANLFAHAECMNLANINGLRDTFCKLPTNRFVQDCIDGGINDNGRVVFCAIPGNRFNPMCIANGLDGAGRGNWCADPANRFNSMCIDNNIGDDDRMTFCGMPANRFVKGCIDNNLGGGGRTTFCEMTENRFNQNCIDNMLGGGGRTTFCGMSENRFDMDCIDNNLGDDDRDTFCATLPTNRFNAGCIANDLGDNERISFCGMPANRFDPGCIAIPLGGDDRTSFCNMPDNLFVKGCTDNELGSDTDRDDACLMYGRNAGAGGHATCPMRPEVIKTCKMNPFSSSGNPGCADISNIDEIQDTYCAGTQADSIANGSAADECNVNYADWTGGFTGTLATTVSTTNNQFLGDITPTSSGSTSLDLNTAKFDGRGLGGDAQSGLGFSQQGSGAGITYQAGVFTTTNLGRPIETTTGTAKWNGSFSATNMVAAADFTLHINFASRAIAGIVRNGTTANYYYVNGSYTAGYTGGLITGTVNYGTFSATEIDFERGTKLYPTSASTTSGTLRGIIGQDGAIGVFVRGHTPAADGTLTSGTGANGYAGGFVVNPVAQIIPTVDYDDWAIGFGVAPPVTPTTPTRLNQFLNGRTDRLEAAFGGENPPPALDFDSIHSLNRQIDSDTNNGVAWFSVEDSPNRYYYAGIFETTDLGLPVTGKTATKVIWSGQFESNIGSGNNLRTSTDFQLEITFGGSGDIAGSIEAFVERGNQTSPATVFFHLNGTYDALGVITGNVYYGEFSDTDARTQMSVGAAANGVLSGLIGSNGAVGAFISGTTTDNGQTIAGGTGDTGYAGGFVASPFSGEVSYRDWVKDGNAIPTPADSPQPAPLNGNLNQFLTTTGNALNKGVYKGADENYNFASLLDGDPADGFSVHRFTEAGKTHHFAGFSSTTSVGAVLPVWQTGETASAIWKGKFVVYETGQDAATHDFDLIVDFQNSDISADVAGYSFTDVGFDSKGVVVQGTITRAATSNPVQNEVTGRMQAIIGQEGAVGVFHSDTNNAFSYGGGFVVATPVVNHAAWVDSFGASPPPATRVAVNAGTAAVGSFLNLGDGVRDISPTSPTSLTGTNTNTHLTLDGNGTNGEHGVTYLSGKNAMNRNQAFVAVLPTTNLGAPLVGPPVIAIWPGKFFHAVNQNTPQNTPDINFEIKFSEQEITAEHEFVIAQDIPPRITTFTLEFTYTGVITGNVTTNIGASATARGLIGTDGLVGVFVDETPSQEVNTGVFFGGFIADNPNN